MITCPYKGLAPYTEEDARYFFGRDTERRIIADNLRASRLTLLYGPSGVGKSSVLNAGVAHDLKHDPDYALLIFRDWRGDPALSLNLAITARLGVPPAHPGLFPNVIDTSFVNTLERYGEIAENSETEKPTLLIVLDQFEEYFQYQGRDAGEFGFGKQLAALLNRRDLPVHFLLSIRDDSLAALDRFKAEVPALLDNRLSIKFLATEDAPQAIIKPLERFNEDLREGRLPTTEQKLHPVEIDAKLAAEVVDEIVMAQGERLEGVQTAYLQLVMTRWWEREMAGSSPQMLRRTLEDLGGVKTIVERYLADTLAALSPAERELAAEAFRYMVTPSGRKIAQTVSDLARSTYSGERVRRETLDGMLEKLLGARVLSAVPPPRGSRPEERCYEFAHDVVAKAAYEWRKQFRQAQELAEARKREEEASNRAQEQEHQTKRFRRLAFALGVVLLLALGVTVLALWKGALARARELVAASLSSEEIDPELSVLIAAESVAETWPWGHTVLPEAEDKLHRAIVASHVRLTLSGHSSDVLTVAWSPDGKRLATGSLDDTAKVWDAESGKELLTLRSHTGAVISVAWSPDGKRLATASADKTAKLWDAKTGKEVLALSGHINGVWSVAWSPDGKRLATASADKTAKLWDAETGKEVLTLRGHISSVWSVAWSPDGRRLATGSDDTAAKVWEAETGKELLTLRGHSNPVASVTWSPDGKRLATGSWDQTAKVWDAGSGKELLTLRGHNNQVTSVAWSQDRKRLATGSWDQTAKVWDAETGKELMTLRDHINLVETVVWSPDGERVATGSWDQTAKVWDVGRGWVLLSLSGHTGAVLSVAWSPDGKRLATGSQDNTAKVWESESGKELLTLSGHSDLVNSAAWSPGGKRLATASGDGTVQIYAMDIHDLMALARQRVTAHPSEEGCKKYLHVDKCPPFPELSFW